VSLKPVPALALADSPAALPALVPAGEEATADFSRAFGEGGEGIADAGNRIRKSEVGRDIKSAFSDGSSRLSDGSSGGYSGREVKSNIKGALRDIDGVADDVAGR
jgi:hypothetical protein